MDQEDADLIRFLRIFVIDRITFLRNFCVGHILKSQVSQQKISYGDLRTGL